jgi:hypothetical protein
VPTPAKPTKRQLVDAVTEVPECPVQGHAGRLVSPYGTYDTLAGARQRYQCVDLKTPDSKHTFAAVLPRSAVENDTCCQDCKVLTPKNAGLEAVSRRTSYSVAEICSVLRDLSQGMPYTDASMRALELMDRPTGRSRRVGQRTVKELNDAGLVGTVREQRAHWHIAADILERYGPVVTEAAFAQVQTEEADYRAMKRPVVYLADEVPVKRDFSRSSRMTSSPVVWSALVVARTRWNSDEEGQLTGNSSRLLRVRALPNGSTEAWRLVFSELDAPDFLVADGATPIEKAAQQVWGNRTVFVPCMYHAVRNIMKNLTGRRAELPEKVRDHRFLLTRDWMEDEGADAVIEWFDQLETLAAAAGLPADAVRAQRDFYRPLLVRTAAVAQAHHDPEVPLSNSGVEAQIADWVSKITKRRGAMFTNLPRTNLLGDLLVAGAAGALSNTHQLADLLREASRSHNGWAPPPRALVEPAGVMGLRDPMSVSALLAQGRP